MSAKTRKTRAVSRSERKLLLISLASIALLGGIFRWRSSINAVPKVDIPPYPQAPKPNGFDVYMQAGAAIVPPRVAVDKVYDLNPPQDIDEQAIRYALMRKEAWLKVNANVFTLFRKAQKLPCLAPADNSLADPRALKPLRELARVKLIEAHAHEMRGDWERALQSRIGIIQMGQDIGRGAGLMPNLTSTVIQAIGRSDVEETVEKLTAAQGKSVTRRMEGVYARRIQYADIRREDKYAAQRRLLAFMKSPQRNAVNNPLDVTTWPYSIKAYFTPKRTVMRNVTEYYDTQIANALLPYNAPQKAAPVASVPLSDLYTSITDTSTRFSHARNEAANAMWLVAMGLHTCKLEHGAYPATLQSLVPAYLKQIPADPYGGRELLRYKRAGTSYVLWSIGPDGVDNGGAPIQHPADASPARRKKPATVLPDSKGDYVWGRR